MYIHDDYICAVYAVIQGGTTYKQMRYVIIFTIILYVSVCTLLGLNKVEG